MVGDSNEVRGSLGDDVVEVHGASNQVHGGPGDDTITASGGDVLSLENRKHGLGGDRKNWAIGRPNEIWGGAAEFVYVSDKDWWTPCHNAWCHWGASARDSCNGAPCLDTVKPSRRLDSNFFPFIDEGEPWPHEFTKIYWMEDVLRARHFRQGPVRWADSDIAFVDQCPWTERFDPKLDQHCNHACMGVCYT